MRRTYRSKKGTGGALEHRDVILNADEKSSAFEAFYIQNIKQTKRELSCVGTSNVYGADTKKVRKRKYVKRIVKEVENAQPRESTSTSAYLTPDKSIRVNKVLDPFDMLLNSSTNGQTNNKDNTNDVFDQLLPKKEGKTYTRKKRTRVKKINYASDYSSSSEKENTPNLQLNTTDIRTHELLVEKELNSTPKYFDESINKIVNNLSLINNFKRKTANTSFNTSYKHRNRLLKNCQSPILQKSPLCSTPFKEKYRGKSIYNFSPISIKGESTNYLTITEENNESNNSIILLCKEKVPKLSKDQKLSTTKKSVDYVKESPSINKSLIYEDEIVPIQDLCETNYVIENEPNSELASTGQSLFQITEAEPFLGFSDDKSVATDKDYLMKFTQEYTLQDDYLDKHDMDSLENTRRNLTIENKNYISNNDISLENLEKEDTNESNNSVDEQALEMFNVNKAPSSNSSHSQVYDNESMYDTCNSEQSTSEENIIMKEPIVAIEKMNDSLLNKYINKPAKEPKIDIERMSDSVFMKYYENMLKNDDHSAISDFTLADNSQSMFNGSESNHNDSQIDDNETQSNLDGDQCRDESQSKRHYKRHSDVDENLDKDASSNISNCSQNNLSSTSKYTESDSVETQPNEIIITDSSTAEDMESNDESSANEDEKFVSFVTTRRRNEIINDSMFIFDNSYGSSSTDCDKTVLSNKIRVSCFEKSEEQNLSINTAGTSDNNEFDSCNGQNIEDEDTISKITKRKSSMLTRQRDKNEDINSSLNEVTIIGNKDVNEELFHKQTVNNPQNTLTTVTTRRSSRMLRDSNMFDINSRFDPEIKLSIVLQPGKKWERSLSIYRRMTMADHFDQSLLEDEGPRKGRKYRQSVISTMEMQDSLHNESINSRRSTFISKPSRPTIRFVKDSNNSRISLNTTTTDVFDDLKGFLTEECDDTVIELSKLSLADSEFEVTVLDNFHETSGRLATARDYVLRRCNQTDPILFDECYPETVLKNCHKIGEGVYGEVFLWRGRDGRARVMKIVPIAGTVKVNGETQKDFHEVISEIVIAMELSALRAPIADIDRYFDEGKDVAALDLHSVENATDVFNEVLAVRCVQGPYPSRLLDLWELYDECKGSENDNPASLPVDQQYIVLELANAGQDLESYQFTGAQQAHALFQQIAFGLAVGEESFQFEHRDLHWGNVLIAPTEQKLATFVLRGRTYRVGCGGVRATIIDYSLSRISLPLAGDRAALYNDLAADEQLFEAVGDYQFQLYRLMRDKLQNDWKNFEPYTNILWLHYTVDKMITALRYKRPTTKIHKHYIEKLSGIKDRILNFKSATEYVLTVIEI